VLLGPLAGARETLWRLVAELKAGNSLDPVTVVVPSTYAQLSLRQEAGRSGMANLRFDLLPRLSELLGAPALSAQKQRPMTHLLEASGVRTVAAAAEGPLADSKDHPQTRRSLRNTFRQLRHASDTALDRLAEGPPVPAETVRLFRRFRDLTEGFYDREELAKSAALSVTQGQATGLGEMGPVIVYLVHDFTPGERELVEALANRSSCTVLLGLTGDDKADRTLRATAQRLSPVFGSPEAWHGDSRPTDSRLVVTPNGQQEVRWAIRHILEASEEEGVPFHRMAVLYRKTDPYGVLIREELELAGIPVAGPDTTPLAQRAAGRTLLGLLRLSTSELSRDEVMAWLTGCPIRSPDRQRDGAVSPTQWDLISRKAGVVRGREQWRDRLDRYADRMSELAARSVELGDTSESRATGMAQESLASRALRNFMAELAERVKPPADGSTWAEFTGWARGLMQAYFDSRADLPTDEADSEQRVTETLQELEGADTLEPNPTFSVFVQAIEESLESAVGHLGQTGRGVFVGPLAAALGLEFDLVHIAGMVEGAVPPRTRDDPLVPDRDRSRVGGPAHGLPLQLAHRDEERYDYLAALATGSRRVLSYPVSDPIGGRAQYPSRWFLEEATVLEGAPVYTSTLGGMSHRPWLSRIASVESALSAEETGVQEVAADIHDYDVGSIWRWREAGLPVSQHPLVGATSLARGFDLESGRRSQRLTRWDGDVSGAATHAKRIDSADLPSYSPSSLERWATCPFSYLLGHELELGALDRPEDITTISPAEKGLLIHKVLELFITTVQEQGTFPPADQPWDEDQRATLHRIADKALGDAEARGATGKALLWDLERRDILNDLDSFLEADGRQRAHFGTAVAHVEARFGMSEGGPKGSWPEPSIELPDGGRLAFHGLIDRVDVTSSGRDALVIDYKTGSAAPYTAIGKDPIDRGRRLQLPVYSLAARGALGEDARVHATYWFVSQREGFKQAPKEPVALDDVLDRFQDAVSTIVSGMRGGLFPANPGQRGRGSFDNCRYCDFDSLCPAYRDVSWRRKKADPRLSRYRELASPDDESQS
jgi:RecB family exonuclease